jgi:hypothetical protein
MEKLPSTETNQPVQSDSPQVDMQTPPGSFWGLSSFFKSIRRHPFKVAVSFLALIMIILIGLLVYTSHLNTDRYYLQSHAGALEVWQGTFSPAGKKLVVIMPGIMPPDKIKPLYTRQEVYPLIFNYYLERSDALIHAPGVFDFTDVKIYLDRALTFAITDEHRRAAAIRSNRIDRVILLYKAEVAASKGSIASLQAAVGFLDQAASLEPDDIESELINKKKQTIEKLINNLKAD